MKTTLNAASRYLNEGAPAALTLVYGNDPGRSRAVIRALAGRVLGAKAAEELRVEQFDWKAIAADPATLFDAVRAVGFFGGVRGVIVNDVSDSGAQVLADALEGWRTGDAHIFAYSGSLSKASKLRKALENSDQTMFIAAYDDPPNANLVAVLADKHGLRIDADAAAMLLDFARESDAIALENEITKLALYQGDNGAALDPAALGALLPQAATSDAQRIVNTMLEGRAREMVQMLRLAPAQGVSTHHINATARRTMAQILEVKASRDPRQTMAAFRPPLFGDRRQAFEAALRRWNSHNAEQALGALAELEADLRSGDKSLPEGALAERIFLRVALLARPSRA